ncbi:UNVERIFIED_CONTAM: hypothetical protein Cloal_3350 [Acetivibrio alkalicellulosi]
MRGFSLMKKTGILVLFVILSIAVVHIVQAVYAEEEDSITVATSCYVDFKINELKQEADLKITELTSKIEDLEKELQEIEQYGKFVALELNQDQRLITGASGEIILRGGKAKAIGGEGGGLSDITAGTGADINTDEDVPLNHLLLISRDDGRGLRVVSSKAWVLVKGPYTIE